MGHTHRKAPTCEDMEPSQDVIIEQIDGHSEVQEEEISIYREISYMIVCNEFKSESEMDKDLRKV